jgi:YHS domain-containing protein
MKLPIDPVCTMRIVDDRAAKSSIHEGDTYYFCSETCKNKFDEMPELYARPNPAGPILGVNDLATAPPRAVK